MNAERYERLRRAFHEVAERPAPERQRAVDEAFPDDATLREELRKLVRDAAEDGGLALEPIADEARRRIVDQFETRVPDDLIRAEVGGFRIERRIGRGAGSTVYLAVDISRRSAPVALKVLDAGFVSADARRRFEREAGILGRLDHVGVARLVRAGTATVGGRERPFLATEFIDGPNLIDHARRRGLDTRQRLELLAYVATAVHHAHEQGVIHRDLKPSNILVTPGGQPKVLDFGVAQVLELHVDAAAERTRPGELIGTVAYMSPEQAAGDPMSVDARSDVYSLGVLGYELLAGRPPYDLAGRSIHEQLRIVRESPPAPLREADPRFAGAVEAIVNRALEKDPEHRYQSARAFASDIRASLRDDPVNAKLTTGSGLVMRSEDGSAARRLRFGLVVAAVGIAGGVLGFLFGLLSAGWLQGAGMDEMESLRADIRAAQAEADAIREGAQHSANVLRVSADRHAAAGRYADAAILFRELLAIQEDLLGSAHADTLGTRERLGETLRLAGDAPRAVPVLREAVERRIEMHGADDRRTIEARRLLAGALADAGQASAAIEQYQAVLDAWRPRLDPDDPKIREIEQRIDLLEE